MSPEVPKSEVHGIFSPNLEWDCLYRSICNFVDTSHSDARCRIVRDRWGSAVPHQDCPGAATDVEHSAVGAEDGGVQLEQGRQ